MSEAGSDYKSQPVNSLTPPPAPRAVPPSPPEGRGTVAGGEAAEAYLRKADPVARRKLLLLVLAGAVVLLGMSWWFQAYLDDMPTDSGQEMVQSTRDVIAEFLRVLYGGSVLLGLLAAYWFQLGRTIEAAPQYPLPQMRLFHDMRILRGEAKRKYARRTRYSAAVALVLAALLLGTALVLPHSIASDHPILYRQSAPAAGSAAGKGP